MNTSRDNGLETRFGEVQFVIPADVRESAQRERFYVQISGTELIELLDEADDALNGDSNDAEHDALYSLRESLSLWFEDPTRRIP